MSFAIVRPEFLGPPVKFCGNGTFEKPTCASGPPFQSCANGNDCAPPNTGVYYYYPLHLQLPVPQPASSMPSWLWIGAAAAAGYFLSRR